MIADFAVRACEKDSPQVLVNGSTGRPQRLMKAKEASFLAFYKGAHQRNPACSAVNPGCSGRDIRMNYFVVAVTRFGIRNFCITPARHSISAPQKEKRIAFAPSCDNCYS